MKRKDWKIKKLKKNTYDKFSYRYLRRRKRIFFLRKLFMRKNSLLFKKNLTPHFSYFNNILIDFKKNKTLYAKNFIFKKKNNFFIVLPNYFIKKKVFFDYNNFLNFLKVNNFNHLFLKNSSVNSYGANIYIFENKYKNCNLNFFLKNFEKNNDKNIISIKHTIFENIETNGNTFSFFINYNLYVNNLIEIYKILIMLNVANSIK